LFPQNRDPDYDTSSAPAPGLANGAEVALAQIVPSLSRRLKQRALNNSRHFSWSEQAFQISSFPTGAMTMEEMPVSYFLNFSNAFAQRL
jgi:hypothetical protein